MIKLKLKKKFILLTTITIIILTLVILLMPDPVPVQIAQVIRGDFYATINSDAIFRGKDRYTVTSMGTADMDRMPLKVGDVIYKGDIITRIWWDSREKYLRAPVNGVVSKVFRESAGPVIRGEPIVEIIDPKKLEVVAELLTSDAVQLKIGSPVVVKNWGGSITLQAVVTKISQIGFKKPSALGVEEERTEVIADLIPQSEVTLHRIGHNFYTDVIFIVSKISGVLKVPMSALFKDGDRWMVYLVKNHKAQLREVEVLKFGPDEAAISKGLKEGEFIINYPGDLVRDGVKVKKL